MRCRPTTARWTRRWKRSIKADYAGFREPQPQAMMRRLRLELPPQRLSAFSKVGRRTRARSRRAGRSAVSAFLGTFYDLMLNHGRPTNWPPSSCAARSATSSRTRPRPQRCAPTTRSAASGCAWTPATTRHLQPAERAPGRPGRRRRSSASRHRAGGWRAGHVLDALVLATGFDAMTGTLLRLDLRGRDGLPHPGQVVQAGPLNYLGLMPGGLSEPVHVTGPGSHRGLHQR
jgi:hypothetical protein